MLKREDYRASEICSILEVKPYVLRFWESEFPEIEGKFDSHSGQKSYSDKSIRAIKVIKHLLFVEKLSIEQAKGLILKHGIDGLTLQFFAHELEKQFLQADEPEIIEDSDVFDSEESSNLSQNKIENFFGPTPYEEVYGEAFVVREEVIQVEEHQVKKDDYIRPVLGASEKQKLILAKAKLNSILISIEGIQGRTNL